MIAAGDVRIDFIRRDCPLASREFFTDPSDYFVESRTATFRPSVT